VLIFHPVLVATDSKDEEGHLAFHDGKLVAVFVRLAGVEHCEDRGRLYLEASFGSLAGVPAQTFASLDEAAEWLIAALGAPEDGAAYSIGEPIEADVAAGLSLHADRSTPR
jgi:hypothetical protein